MTLCLPPQLSAAAEVPAKECVKERVCLRCRGRYLDDSNSLCPQCDSDTAHNANLDAGRVLDYRLKGQAKLQLAKDGPA